MAHSGYGQSALPVEPAANSPGEPALTVAGVAAGVGALLALLVAFGVDLSDTQRDALLSVVLVVGPLVLGWITRAKVFAPKTVAALLARARGNGQIAKS